MPGLKSADQPVLGEKLIISPRNASVSEWTRPRILKMKTSRDTKQLSRDLFSSESRLLSFSFPRSCFSVIFLFLLANVFRYLFLDPPWGMSKQKNSFTLQTGA